MLPSPSTMPTPLRAPTRDGVLQDDNAALCSAVVDKNLYAVRQIAGSPIEVSSVSEAAGLSIQKSVGVDWANKDPPLPIE